MVRSLALSLCTNYTTAWAKLRRVITSISYKDLTWNQNEVVQQAIRVVVSEATLQSSDRPMYLPLG